MSEVTQELDTSPAAIRALFEDYSGSALCGTNAIAIEPGDWYWAHRNGPPQILKCKHNNVDSGWVVPTTSAYWYSTVECFRLKPGVPDTLVANLAAKLEVEFAAWSKAWHAAPLGLGA
jgi:hypothetical protein